MKSLHFLYHELRPEPSTYSYVVECAEFDRHCELFSSLRRAPSTLQPEITFDDGHRSNFEFALPILQRHNLRARFFITSGWIGQRAGYLDWDELCALHAAGQSIGAHGCTHMLLTHCTDSELDRELTGARQRLEDGLGAAVTTMSLPGGRGNPRILEACWKAGYTQVFTSVPRAAEMPAPPRSTVGRLNLRGGTNTAWLQQVLTPKSGLLARLERKDRLKSKAKTFLGDRLYARLWAVVNHEEPETDAAGMQVQ
jgi:peptidoglycan/xylan/chitin deacetylase (PgdA/CDA1 family)